MKKLCLSLFVLILALIGTQLYSQAVFPMKGSYIYYSFNNKEHNTKKCLKQYTEMSTNGQMNSSAQELTSNVVKRTTMGMSNLKVTLGGLKLTTITFYPTNNTNGDTSCVGEFSTPTFNIMLPAGSDFIPKSVLEELITIGKFKVTGQQITATFKVRFISKSEYNIIFTNFKIIYSGMQGLKPVTNLVLNLEDVYQKVSDDGKQKDLMYSKSKKTIEEIDRIVKECAKIYQEELKRIYEIDEL